MVLRIRTTWGCSELWTGQLFSRLINQNLLVGKKKKPHLSLLNHPQELQRVATLGTISLNSRRWGQEGAGGLFSAVVKMMTERMEDRLE